MLTLPINKKWFDMIVSGEKKEEYRDYTHYYTSRFHIEPSYEELVLKCILRNGYSNKSPSIGIDYTIEIGCGKIEWGAEVNKKYIILKINNLWKVK